MLTQRLFAHAMKKHNLSVYEYLDKFQIDRQKFIKRKEYYKNGTSRRETVRKQKRRINNKTNG